MQWHWTGSSHTSSGWGWCTPHCTHWRRCRPPTEGTQWAPLRSMGCTSGRGCSSLGGSRWGWRGTQWSHLWNSPRRVLVCSLRWPDVQHKYVWWNHLINHFSSENKKQQKANYREFSPIYICGHLCSTYQKVNEQNGCHCSSLACTPSIVVSIAYPFSMACALTCCKRTL